MHALIPQIEQTIRRHRCFLPGQGILVAVSGGLDSMVLLDLLRILGSGFGWRLVVGHFNHQLRGPASDADERFVTDQAIRLGLEAQTGRGDVRRFQKEHRVSLEMAARQLRHEFLAGTAQRGGLDAIALGHQADDQLELFFLRLLRGTGLEGLEGMQWSSPSPCQPAIPLVRPLLEQPKSTLADYAQAAGLAFREDVTNEDSQLLRNRIRHELLPLLTRHYQPALRPVIARLRELIRAETALVENAVQRRQRQRSPRTFDRWPVAVQRQWLCRELRRLGLEPDFERVEALRQTPGQAVMVGPRHVIARDPAGQVRRVPLGLPPFSTEQITLVLRPPAGQTVFGGSRFQWRFTTLAAAPSPFKASPPPAPGTGVEWWDADRVGDAISLRHWRPGDRFQPLGMAQPARLQDLFTNRKIPPAQRRLASVACTNAGEIFWVEGLPIGEQVKLNPATARALCWHWQPAA